MSKIFKYETFNPYIFALIPKGAKVLDVGCATGLLGKKLRKEKDPEFLAGIESSPGIAREAKKFYDQVVVADIESKKTLSFKKEVFDVIVCGDILEHLKNPLSVLKNLTRYLSEEGFFLISVPNVAFASIRLSLLFGRFDYNPDGGLLDETHLRFFTYKSLVNLLRKAGLKIVFVRGYNLVRPRFFFLKVLGALFPNLFSIQFLAKARKK
ncbi:class I SAM-dependent methyltransferase [Patescibacteria group bacterium]|nr:class I SAM-dependent methyltransferase [Patescibacteria group bacterium]